MTENQKYFFSLCLIILIFISLMPQQASAFTSISSLVIRPFGGRILQIIPPIPFVCWVPQYVIGPPRPLTVAIVPIISTVYKYKALIVGNWVLGTAIPPMPFICHDAFVVLKIGTSATP